jgi:hypothetical protein
VRTNLFDTRGHPGQENTPSRVIGLKLGRTAGAVQSKASQEISLLRSVRGRENDLPGPEAAAIESACCQPIPAEIATVVQ